MSHFTEVKTEIKDKESLKKALTKLGIEFQHSDQGLAVRGFYGDSIKAEFCLTAKGNYDIGLKLNEDGCYELIADWSSLAHLGIDQETYVNQLKQKYAHVQLIDKLNDQGFQVEEETLSEDGSIQLTVSQWR